jgi:hypothetical protein
MAEFQALITRGKYNRPEVMEKVDLWMAGVFGEGVVIKDVKQEAAKQEALEQKKAEQEEVRKKAL